MSEGPSSQPPAKGVELVLWCASSVAAGLCLLLAVFAYSVIEETTGTAKYVEAIYSSAQLLMLHVPFEEITARTNVEGLLDLFHLARVFALIAWGTGTIAVILFFWRMVFRFWVTLRGSHVIVCGLSPVGKRLVHELRHTAPREPVVVLDTGLDPAAAEHVWSAGAHLIGGEGFTHKLLHRAGLRRAARLFATSDDAAVNVSIAMTAMSAMPSRQSRYDAPDVFIHIPEPQLRRELRRHYAFRSEDRNLRVHMFDVFEHSARHLLAVHPLDYVPITPDDSRTVQVIVVGFDNMGEAVLTRAAMSAHFANLKPLQALVIDPDAARKESTFRTRYPHFHEVCHALFEARDPDVAATHERIAAVASNPATISTVVICLDSDTRGLVVALSLAARLGPAIPIRVKLAEQSALRAWQGQDGISRMPGTITTFGSLEEGCSRKNWSWGGELDTMARAIHQTYITFQTGNATTDDRSMRPWGELDDELIDSNRQAADHARVKLRAINYHAVAHDQAETSITEFSSAQVELLAKMEHQRWNAERYLGGWSRGPKDVPKRLSPYLVPWGQLEERIKEFDRNFVRTLPGAFSLAGFDIRGQTAPGSMKREPT